VKKLLFIFLTIIFFVSALFFFIVMPIAYAFGLPVEIRLSNEEYETRAVLPMHRLIRQEQGLDVAVDGTSHKYIDLKLFGLIKVRRIRVEVLPVDELAVGGVSVGFSVKMCGVMVVENAPQYGLKKGDIIKKINDSEISSMKDFNKFVGELGKGKHELNVEFKRGKEVMTTKIEYDNDGIKTLGIWLKDETTGVGTLTYINPQNNNFAALGHNVTDHDTGVHIDVRSGDVYRTNILGLTKSQGRKVGELRSTLRQGTSKKQGTVISSSDGGVFGCLFADSEILKEATKIYPVASRYSVRPGKAKLRTTIDEDPPQEYDIEILKTYYQSKRATKSLVLRITDKELLEKTGGIVHGMSGSPIIQNGKIVGALTHVIVGDATKGYGIYIDFVIP
jgi:stage IV sporulation protein B